MKQIPGHSPRIKEIKNNLIEFFKVVKGDLKNISRELISRYKINELNSVALSNTPIDSSSVLAKFLNLVVTYYKQSENNEIQLQKIDQEIKKLELQQAFNIKNEKKEPLAYPQKPAIQNSSKIKHFFYPIQQVFRKLWNFFTK